MSLALGIVARMSSTERSCLATLLSVVGVPFAASGTDDMFEEEIGPDGEGSDAIQMDEIEGEVKQHADKGGENKGVGS